MIRVDDKEYNAHGTINTDGVMEVEFESDESLDEINANFSNASSLEVLEQYEIKSVKELSMTNGNPRTISIKLAVVPVSTSDIGMLEETESLDLDSYKQKVVSMEMSLEDVPAEYRDKIAIMLGV